MPLLVSLDAEWGAVRLDVLPYPWNIAEGLKDNTIIEEIDYRIRTAIKAVGGAHELCSRFGHKYSH